MLEPLPCSQLALVVLTLDGALTACVQGFLAALAKLLDAVFGAHFGAIRPLPRDDRFQPASTFDFPGLRMATPYALHHLAQTDSTQDDARLLFEGEPVLVVADRQVKGRGREGRGWRSAPRAVAASLAFRPGWPIESWPLVSPTSGLAARNAIGQVTGSDLGIKWPNDLVSDRGKVAGLLVEADNLVVVAGLGANLWWPDPPAGYAGLLDADPGNGEAVSIARRWAEQLLTLTALPEHEWGRDEFERHCLTIGERIRWKPDGAGTAVAVAEDGSLVVETDEGRLLLRVSEVWEVRSNPLPPI